ncbi:hypothetical protein BGW38_009859, partial [Lunasporangiospora selenospora]
HLDRSIMGVMEGILPDMVISMDRLRRRQWATEHSHHRRLLHAEEIREWEEHQRLQWMQRLLLLLLQRRTPRPHIIYYHRR